MTKIGAGALAQKQNPGAFRDVQNRLLNFRTIEHADKFDEKFDGLLAHVRATFSKEAAKNLVRFLTQAKDQVSRWTASHGRRNGGLFCFTSNPSESWHAVLKSDNSLSYRASLKQVFTRTTELQAQRSEACRRAQR